MDNLSIKIDSVSKTLGNNIDVLTDINLDVPKNAFIQIKGASGSGKSTLLHIIAGLLDATNGKVFIDGNIANDPKVIMPPYKRNISLLFQDLALWPHMKALDQLKLVQKEKDEDLIETVCEQIQLPKGLLSKYPSQLSGGEQQRLAIARALCANPRILLLDEPFTALDSEIREALVVYLNNRKTRHDITMILVSHDLLSSAVELDEEYLLINGRLKKLR